jgi:hypothetical protein
VDEGDGVVADMVSARATRPMVGQVGAGFGTVVHAGEGGAQGDALVEGGEQVGFVDDEHVLAAAFGGVRRPARRRFAG